MTNSTTWLACSALCLAGPIVALSYSLIVWGMFAYMGECRWTDKLLGHMMRMGLVGAAVGVTKMLQETERRTQQFELSTLVVGCMGLNLALILWGVAAFFIYQTRKLDVVGSLNTRGIFSPIVAPNDDNDKANPSSQTNLQGKVALITGANTGIGKETARQLAQLGVTIIMACRSETRANQAIQDILQLEKEKEHARGLANTISDTNEQEQRPHHHHSVKEDQFLVLPIDLGDFESIRRAVQLLDHDLDGNTFPRSKLPSSRIDILINNAGVMMGTKTLSKDGYELMMQANHLGHFLLTNLLLPKLLPPPITGSKNPKESNATSSSSPTPARILCISSSTYALSHKTGFDFDDMFCENGRRPYTLFGQYSMTKLANILMAREMSRRYDPSMIQVFAVHPGIVRTDVTRNMPWYLRGPNYIFSYFVAACQKTPAEGAFCSVFCATAAAAAAAANNNNTTATTTATAKKTSWPTVDAPGLPPNGSFVVNCRAYPTLPFADSSADAKRLWESSEKLVGLQQAKDEKKEN